jgi:hypothetical protein
MVPRWKRWLGAASILLLAGAGCRADVGQETTVETGAGETEDDGRMGVDAPLDFRGSADAAADAMLEEAEADAMLEYEEGNDADVVTDDAAELDAYGKAYVQSEL